MKIRISRRTLLAGALVAGGAVVSLRASAKEGDRSRSGRSGKKGPLEPVALRCEYLVDPVAIEETAPRLSWRLEGEARGRAQTAYRILVASSAEKLARGHGDLWDSGKIASNRTSGIAYAGKALGSRAQCFWKVRVWDEKRRESDWSAAGTWGMGLLQAGDWKAEWISYRDESPLHESRQTLYLPAARQYRTDVRISRPVRRAVLYATALGDYALELNGARVSDARFTPGWSDYRRRVYYNAYDVTSRLVAGENGLGAVVADGWYSGYVGYGLLVGYGPHRVGRYFYGKTPALRVQLEVEYADGTHETFGSSAAWKVTGGGPTVEADMLMGERYDARKEIAGWSRAGFDARGWENAIPAAENGSHKAPFFDSAGQREVELGFIAPARLQAYPGVPVRPIEEIRPVRITEPKPGTFLFDLGVNFAGVARLQVKGPAGTEVRLRFGEMLHPDGTLMTENLRRARATDSYVLRGDPNGETWTPNFTYHGFQYVEVTGYPGKPGLDAVTGIVIHSDTPRTSKWECSDPVINRFYANAVRTQLANFVEIPTDCPQRDERLGWMGDAQIYCRAATYHADVAAFFTKWIDDVDEAQLPNGAYPDYAPYPMFHGNAAGWGTAWTDAGVICPYTIYRVYGDTRIIQRHWDSLQRFMEFRKKRSPDYRGHPGGNHWGDWLSLGGETPIELVDAAYFAHSARLTAEMAATIGKTVEARDYGDTADGVAARFAEDYLKPDGTLKVETQTAYALALAFDLLPAAARQPAADHLAGMIRANGNRMATGFLGTQPLLPVLSAHGHHDLAVALLQSRQFPSWGYEVVNGATSVWERWNSFTKEKGFGDAAMNSFSHYAFGAVTEWMFRGLAGIDTAEPGFQKLVLRPGPPHGSMGQGVNGSTGPEVGAMQWVRAEYDSLHGPIRVAWKRDGEHFEYEVSLPPNTTAELVLLASKASQVTEGGAPIGKVEGVRVRQEMGLVVLALGSGSYGFRAEFRTPD
jgi:alpha-L-rhamnosidase